MEEDFVAAVEAGFGVGAAEWAGLRCASEEEGFCGASVGRALGIASIGEDFGEAAGSPSGVSWAEEGGSACRNDGGLFYASSEEEGFGRATKKGDGAWVATTLPRR